MVDGCVCVAADHAGLSGCNHGEVDALRDLLLSTEFWQNIRYIVIYPLLTVSGITWAIGFYLHYHFTKSHGDLWAARVGIGILILSISGMFGLFVAQRDGFSAVTSIFFSVGTIVLCGVMVAGAIWMLLHHLKKEHP
jgi:hypothetical protein